MTWVILGGGRLSNFLVDFSIEHKIKTQLVTRLECDLLNLESVRNLFNNFTDDITIVISASVTRLIGDSASNFEQNIKIISNIVSSLNENVKHIIFFSSVDVYGLHPSTPITEVTPLSPFDYYGLSKQVNEFFIQKTLQNQDIPWTIFRLSGLYGNKLSPMGVIGNICNSAFKKRVISVEDTDVIERDYVFAGDVPYFVSNAIRNSVTGIFNLVTGESFSIKMIANEIIDLLPNCKLEYYKKRNKNRPGILRFNNQKLVKSFAGVRLTTLKRGIALQL